MSSGSSIRLGTGDLAKYPFLNEAGSYLRVSGFTWEELERSEIRDIVARAVDRVNAAAKGEVYKSLERYEVEIISFLVSLILVKSIAIDSLTKKYALAEARRAEDFLSTDMKKSTESQRQSLLAKIFEDLFNLNVNFDSKTAMYAIRVTSYLQRASHFHEQEWKLVNRPVTGGMVYLDADQTVRLVRNELVQLILERMESMNIPVLPNSIKDAAEQMRQSLSHQFEYRPAASGKTPPCVKHALDSLTRGENLSHAARVMLATYLLATDKSVDEIISVFQNAPDYNEKITRYQIEHLAGSKGSRTKYSVPSCQKLQSQNLCYATAECNGIFNPVQFGRRVTN